MEEYLPVFLLYWGICMAVSLIAHFFTDGGLFSMHQGGEFGEEEFSIGFWLFGSLFLPLIVIGGAGYFVIQILINLPELLSGRNAKKISEGYAYGDRMDQEERERVKEQTKRRKEERAEVLKNPSVVFEKFKKGGTALNDYKHLIAILENSRNSDKDNSDEIVEIVREAYLAISGKKWNEKNKRKYEEILMKELEELSNG